MRYAIINLFEHSYMKITSFCFPSCEISAVLPREYKKTKILPCIEKYIPLREVSDLRYKELMCFA